METLMPLAMFAFVSSITPGPNNIMLSSSGLRFGFNRTVPHIFGVTFGFGVMLTLCALGIGSLLLALPAMHLLLKTLGSTYLLYLAWQLRSIAFSQGESRSRPMTFFGAALFQFVNPKAWIMAITGVSAFMPVLPSFVLAIGLFCLVFCLINVACISVWVGTGAALREHLKQSHWQRLFCAVMVILTVYSAAAIWL